MNIQVIRASGAIEQHEIPKHRAFEAIEKLIGASGCDTVNLRDGRVLIVDDCGAIADPPRPANPEATKLYHSVCRTGTTWEIKGDAAVALDADFA